MSTMAEVVEESLRLLSEVRSVSREGLAEHVAAELAKAGYGNMADAWDEGVRMGGERAAWVIWNRPMSERPDTTNPYPRRQS
jgi:hypothetical protein